MKDVDKEEPTSFLDHVYLGEGQEGDAASACTHVKMEDAPTLLLAPKSDCPDIWIRLTTQVAKSLPKHSRSSGSA